MKETIFEYTSYKSYLNDWIRSNPNKKRGLKSELAIAARCQTTYISQVLHGDKNFSPEQTELINLYLGHSGEEAKFFMLLVSRQRAGIPELRNRIETELENEKEKHRDLKERLKSKKQELTPEIQSKYYRAWYNVAVHICLTIPELRTKESISKSLNISAAKVTEALDFLTSVGLAEKKGSEHFTGTNVTFIGDSPYLLHHHMNWRHQAIRSIEMDKKEDFHYSSVISIPRKDVDKIRSLILKNIEEMREIWKNATNEEELHSICVDFFQITTNQNN